ncbi:condensation domain-containing protein [Bacillus cereus]
MAEKMNNQVSAYNIFRAYIIRGDININCLNKSINRLISRHESLRTRFDVVNNELIQMIYAKVDFKLQVLDLSQKGLDLPNSHITEILREEAQRSFNLDELPLFHAYLIKIKDTEHIFVWNMHHIISDGWSMRVLLKELTCLYNNEIQGEFCNLPEVEIQYADFSEWHREWLETEEAEKQLKYWSDFLSGELPMTQLPSDYSKGNFNFTYKGDSYRETVDLDLFNRTMEFSKKQNVTPFITFLTVFKVLVSRYLEQKDIIIGTPVAGRTASEIENTVGFFVNTLPIRTKLNYDKSFTEILQEVRTVSFNTFENDGIPLQSIIEAINPVRTGGASPIIQSVFTFQESLKEELSFLNLQIEPVIVEDKTAKFELTFVVDRKENDEIDILVEYNTDLFKVDTIKRLVKNYIKALESVLENPQQKIKELEIISESEKDKSLLLIVPLLKLKK